MHRLALVLACSTCAGHRRHVQTSAKALLATSCSPLEAFATFLLSVKPGTAFNPSCARALNPTRTAANPSFVSALPLAAALPDRQSQMVRMVTRPAKKKGKSKRKSKLKYGFGKDAAAAPQPKAAEILKDATDVYEELNWIAEYKPVHSSDISDEEMSAFMYEIRVTEWAIAVRSNSSITSCFRDWVPVAFVNIGCHKSLDPKTLVPAAIGARTRPILISASGSFPVLKKLDKKTLEFAFEPSESFFKHVAENFADETQNIKEAMATLGVSSRDTSELKSAYSKLAAPLQYSPEGAETGPNREKMDRLKAAYDLLIKRSETSYYAGIGGKRRVGFSGALKSEAVEPLGKPRPEQDWPLAAGGWRAGVSGMIPEISEFFYHRNACS